jgi:hypothetical protein
MVIQAVVGRDRVSDVQNATAALASAATLCSGLVFGLASAAISCFGSVFGLASKSPVSASVRVGLRTRPPTPPFPAPGQRPTA